MRFPVVLHTDDGTRYGVTVPDLPGCFSGGDTFDAAMDSAAEAIDLHLEGLTEDGHDVPAPQPIGHHQKNPDHAGGVWMLVEGDVTRFEGKAFERIRQGLKEAAAHARGEEVGVIVTG